MSDMQVLTDDAIRRAFQSRSATAIPSGLAEAIATETAGTRQHAPWPMQVRLPWFRVGTRPVLVFALVSSAILVATFGLGGGSVPTPTETPSPAVTPRNSTAPSPGVTPGNPATAAPNDPVVLEYRSFPRPFEYVLPATASVVPDESSFAAVVVTDRHGTPPGEVPTLDDRRVMIVAIRSPQIHGCPGGDARRPIRTAPADFLEDLRVRNGNPLSSPMPTVLDGRPALLTTVLDQPQVPAETAAPQETTVSPPTDDGSGDCAPELGGGDLHFDNGYPGSVGLGAPTRLIVADVDRITVMVLISAGTQGDFEDWLPIAMELVDSIHFLPPAVTP